MHKNSQTVNFLCHGMCVVQPGAFTCFYNEVLRKSRQIESVNLAAFLAANFVVKSEDMPPLLSTICFQKMRIAVLLDQRRNQQPFSK